MGYEDASFWVLKRPFVDETDAVTEYSNSPDRKLSDCRRCSACHQPMSMLTWEPPFKAEMEFLGKYHGDIAFFVGDLLVSERFVEAFVKEGLTGLDILSRVEVVEVTPREMARGMPTYRVARVQWSRAVFDDIASEADYEERWTCPVCRLAENLLRFKRVSLIEGTWSGEDVFHAVGLSGEIITSKRFKEFCDRHAFKNVLLVKASEFGIDWWPDGFPDEE